MRLRLDDNERGAFHYLFGGVVVVVLLKGIAFITDRLGPTLTPDQAALRHFQQGYPLLRGDLAIVSTPTGLTERLILAIVLAVGVAFILALAFVIFGNKRNRTGKVRLLATRTALVVTLAWSVYAAFLLPLEETRAQHGELILRQRTALIGDIPWPFTLRESRLPGADVLWLEGGSAPPVPGQKGTAWVDVVSTSGSHRAGLVRGFDGRSEMMLLEAASDAAAALERELR